MARVTDTLDAFNGGEYSPLLDGQTGWDKYKLGCRTLINFIPRVQGPAEKTLGTRHVQAAGKPAKEPRMIPFIFGQGDAMMMEFGEFYIRFFRDRQAVMSGLSPYEVVTTYAQAELDLIQFEQKGDIVILTCPGRMHPQAKLVRLDDDNWTLDDIEFISGPVVDGDVNGAVTMSYITPGDAGLSVEITASSPSFGTDGLGFQADHTGSLWAFGEASGGLSPYPEWVPGGVVAAGALNRYAGRLYYTVAGGTNGTFAPIHTSGSVSDGGVIWKFWNYGIGYARMTAWTTATVATFLVQRGLPPTMRTVSPGFQASAFWNEPAWSKVRGFPSGVAFFQQRLSFAGTEREPLFVDSSRNNRRYFDFDPALAEADAAIRNEIDGEQNEAYWMKADGAFLLIGGHGGLSHCGNQLTETTLTPGNASAKSGASRGVARVTPVRTEDGIKCLSRDRKTLLLAGYDDAKLRYQGKSLNVKNPEITGTGLTQLAYQEAPQKMVWATRDDGQLLFLSEEGGQEVLAWGRRITGLQSDGTFDQVVSVAVIPGISGDEVWLAVNRRSGASTSCSIEYIEPTIQGEKQWWYVDAGIQYIGAPTTTIGGLTHLEGRDVAVLADGRALQNRAVSGGAVTFDAPVSNAIIGLPIVSRLAPMLIDGGSENGPSQTKTKNIHELAVRLYRTMGLKIGPTFTDMRPVAFDHDQQAAADGTPRLFGDPRAEDIIEGFDGDYGNGAICIQHDQPLPCTVISLTPHFTCNDK